MTSRIAYVALLSALSLASWPVAGQSAPTGWRWRTDGPAPLVNTLDVPAGSWLFMTMAPGWHLTTGPGALVYHPDYRGTGNYAVEAEIFLFPGDNQQEYGIFFAGRFADAAASAGTYLAFVGRRDGQGAVFQRELRPGQDMANSQPLIDWRANDAILPWPGKDTVKNAFRAEVTPTELIFTANGKEFGRLPRGDRQTDGQFGLRLGRDINLHASRLDLLVKLAPVPIKK